jgi:hypothetical protein
MATASFIPSFFVFENDVIGFPDGGFLEENHEPDQLFLKKTAFFCFHHVFFAIPESHGDTISRPPIGEEISSSVAFLALAFGNHAVPKHLGSFVNRIRFQEHPDQSDKHLFFPLSKD